MEIISVRREIYLGNINSYYLLGIKQMLGIVFNLELFLIDNYLIVYLFIDVFYKFLWSFQFVLDIVRGVGDVVVSKDRYGFFFTEFVFQQEKQILNSYIINRLIIVKKIIRKKDMRLNKRDFIKFVSQGMLLRESEV